MKTGWVSLVVLATVASLTTAESAPHWFAADVTVNQVRSMVDCRAVVNDIASGQVLFKPRVTAKQGDTARAESDGSFSGQRYHATLTVFADATQTSYTLELQIEGAVVFRTKATIARAK